MAISDRFDTLLGRIQLSDAQAGNLARHRDAVTRRIETSFEVTRTDTIGSSSRGSAIRTTSDLDLMPILRRSEARWGGRKVSSTTVLNNIRAELRDRFRFTDAGKDGEAVVVEFSDGAKVDVVPAFYVSQEAVYNGRKYPLYEIPNGRGGWLATSPEAHNRYIAAQDARSGGKLKYVTQLLKFWRACRTPHYPLNSFHIELLLADSGLCSVSKSYAQCLHDTFALLAKRACRGLQDPIHISGQVSAANTDAKRLTVLNAAITSAQRAAKALDAEAARRQPEAVSYWDLVFNGNFPKS